MMQRMKFVVHKLLMFSALFFSSTSVMAVDTIQRSLPDQYIITFTDDISKEDAIRLTRKLSAEHRLRLRHTFKHSIVGFSAVVSPEALEILRNHPSIKSISQNHLYYIEGSEATLYAVNAPTNVTVTPLGTSQLDLAWTDNSDTENGTEIQRSTTGIGGTYARHALLRGVNITSYSDTDVVADQEYCYQIRTGENGTVLSPFSDPVCGIIESSPPSEPPAAPSGLTATTVNDQRIDLAWTDNSSDETSFSVERAVGQGAAFSEIDVTGSNVTTYADTTLAANTEYCYRVRASNSAGDSGYTAEVCATTDVEPPPTSPLGAPTNLTATSPDDSTVDLTWTDNATEEAGFEVQRSTTGIGGTYSPIAILRGANTTSYTDNSVVAQTEYCYMVRAGRGPGDFGDFSAATCITPGELPPTDPPAAPTGLVATAVSDQRIDLDWTDNADDEDGFEVERATGTGGTFTLIDTVGANVTSYASTALAAVTEYCYRARAFNSVGDSAYTLETCATTEAEPPPGVCTDTGNHDDIGLDWGLTQVKAHLNPKWQSAEDPDAGCALEPWFFGLDSGVDSDHPDLNVVEIMGFIAADPTDDGEDGNGHGTHTAGTAAAIDGNGGAVGIAPGAAVYGFKVCGDSGTCAGDDILAGIDEVTARKNANPGQAMVANMSLGGGANDLTDTAVRRSINAGVTYTLSAGNGVFGSCLFPADSANNSPARVGDDAINAADGSDGDTQLINGAITVTSSTQTDNDANCNFGNPVSVAAPGVSIFSTWLNGGTATISGTSMAAPHVAGAAILYLHDNQSATPTEVEQAIVNELDPWTTDDLPNADGRLDVETL